MASKVLCRDAKHGGPFLRGVGRDVLGRVLGGSPQAYRKRMYAYEVELKAIAGIVAETHESRFQGMGPSAKLSRGEKIVTRAERRVSEASDGFGFGHSEFSFPTFFPSSQKVRVSGANHEGAEARGDPLFRELCRKELALGRGPRSNINILQESVVRERFDYKQSGLRVALVRVFRLEPKWTFPDAPAYGGCRSWLKLPEIPAETRLEPVLTEQEYAERAEKFRSLCPEE